METRLTRYSLRNLFREYSTTDQSARSLGGTSRTEYSVGSHITGGRFAPPGQSSSLGAVRLPATEKQLDASIPPVGLALFSPVSPPEKAAKKVTGTLSKAIEILAVFSGDAVSDRRRINLDNARNDSIKYYKLATLFRLNRLLFETEQNSSSASSTGIKAQRLNSTSEARNDIELLTKRKNGITTNIESAVSP